MTKKHFIALADAMRCTKPEDSSNEYGMTSTKQWEQDVRALADFCASQNPRFNRTRWTLYVNGQCGPNGGKI